MEFRILGPLEAVDGGSSVPVGGARQRGVLAILLIHRGEAVSIDRIVDELWGERPPETANKTVQVYVSRLRKALGEGVLVTRGGGYALEVGPDQVDADRFARLAAEGREALEAGDARGAADTLKSALGLWRGRPLDDLGYESFAQSEIARLEELHLDVLEDRIEADLHLGRHGRLVPELETLAKEHPTRERLRGQLMLALYRSGRQSEALASYREAQRTLVAEGLEPGPELQALEAAILRQDPEIAAPPSGPAAVLRDRRTGGALVAGGALLLAAAILAVIASGGNGGEDLASGNSLAVIDPASNELDGSVPTGVQPADVAADGESVWVANRGDDTVTQVDLGTREVVGTVASGTSVAGLATGAGGVWIGDAPRSVLVRVDPAFRAVEDSIHLERPAGLGLGQSAPNPVAVGVGAVWAGMGYGTLARVDPRTNQRVATISLGNDPTAVAIDERGVWVTDGVDNTLTRIDPGSANAVAATIPVGQGPTAVAAGEGAVWVANTRDDSVSRVDPGTGGVTDTIPVGSRPTGVATGEGAVWVANSLDGTVSRIDPATNQVEATVAVGEAPQGVVVADGRIWVSVQALEAPATGDGAPLEGDAARVLIPDDPGPLDPAIVFDFQLLYATCAQLYNYPDAPFPEGAELQPELAGEGSSVSDDGRTYRFEIRPGYRFSPPSNEPVTAEAFERAILRDLHPRMGSFVADLMGDVVGAEAYAAGRTDRLAGVRTQGDTLIVELTEPAPDFPARLAAPYFCAVPPDTPITPDGVDAVPTAGPYYVASHVPDRSIVLRRNPNYDGPRPQTLEEIRYDIGMAAERAVEEVEAGRADYTVPDPLTSPEIPPEVLAELVKRYGPDSDAASAGGQQFFTQPALSSYYFAFNTNREPFSDPRLRRAVNYAIDRRALAAHTGVGQLGRPSDQLLPPGTPGFADATIYPLGGPDLETARRLAGDVRRRAVLYTCSLPGCVRHAEILRSNLRAIGIELDVRRFALPELFGRTERPGEPFDLGYSNWFADYADPSVFINAQFGANSFYGHLFDDPEAKRRMAAVGRKTGDARYAAYGRLDAYLARRAPVVAFASGTGNHFLSARMGCQVLHPIYGLDLTTLCVEE